MNCEACLTNQSSVFCLGCKSYMCLTCETNRHPATHTTVPSQSLFKCTQHEEPYTMYCESCSSLLCSLCIPLHHSAYHQLKSLVEIYRIQSSSLQTILTQRGYAKKNQIELKLEGRYRNIAELNKIIELRENEINETHSAMTKRLELSVAPVTSQLMKDREEIFKDLEIMEKALEVVKGENIIEFLNNYKTIINDLVGLANKRLPIEKEFDVSNMPTELMD